MSAYKLISLILGSAIVVHGAYHMIFIVVDSNKVDQNSH